jgi:hypothetical protein
MATAGRALCAAIFVEFGATQSGRGRTPDLMCVRQELEAAAILCDPGMRRPWIARRLWLAFEAVVARASASCRSALRRVRRDRKASGPLPALASRLSALFALSCGLALAGCASNSAQRESRAAPAIHAATPLHQHESNAVPRMRVAASAHRTPEQRIHRPDRALLAPQPAPDCEFRGSDDLKPVDPDQWARLKLDYERQCYQKAEQTVRDRLQLLQASSRCEIEPVRRSRRLIR